MTYNQLVQRPARNSFVNAFFKKVAWTGTDTYLSFYIGNNPYNEYTGISRVYIPTASFTVEDIDDATTLIYNNVDIYIGPIMEDVEIGGYLLWSAVTGGNNFTVFALPETYPLGVYSYVKIPEQGITVNVSTL